MQMMTPIILSLSQKLPHSSLTLFVLHNPPTPIIIFGKYVNTHCHSQSFPAMGKTKGQAMGYSTPLPSTWRRSLGFGRSPASPIRAPLGTQGWIFWLSKKAWPDHGRTSLVTFPRPSCLAGLRHLPAVPIPARSPAGPRASPSPESRDASHQGVGSTAPPQRPGPGRLRAGKWPYVVTPEVLCRQPGH